jgi:hypothetical protein
MSMTESSGDLMAAARGKVKVRVRGPVVACGGGYSGSYRNAWLEVACDGVRLHLTAGVGTPLGTAPVGSVVDVVVTLTGMVDVAERIFHCRNAQLIAVELDAR